MAIKQFKGTFVPDEWGSEHGYEALLDFEISWVLRVCANQNEQRLRPHLYHQCRFIMEKLTGISLDTFVSEVKVWRQWKCIDVIAEIYVGDILHVLVLEDKAYTSMRPNQREEYPKRVFEHYSKEYPDSEVLYHFCVITFFEEHEDGFKSLKFNFKNGEGFGPKKEYHWDVFSAMDLPDWDVLDYTESDIFNEFWFAQWSI